MNVIKEESKSSHKNYESPKQKNLDDIENSRVGRNNKIKLSHQRHSSKTTKKLELSIASLGKSNEAGTLAMRQLVNARSSSVAFNKQAQRKRRKELKLKQSLKDTQTVMAPRGEKEVDEYYEEVEKKYEQFVIEDHPIKALNSVNDSKSIHLKEVVLFISYNIISLGPLYLYFCEIKTRVSKIPIVI